MRRLLLLSACVLTLLGMAPTAWAQTAMALVRGTVADQQGGVLPGATVTIRHVETNTVSTAVTGPEGKYFVANLTPGNYELTAELSGFGTGRRSFVLRVGQEGTVDLVLRLGAVEETLTVSGQAAAVETQHTVGTHLDTKLVDELPTVGRDFADLAKLAPGVVSQSVQGSGFASGGARQFQNNIIVDGATNVMQFYGTQADLYPQDWVQEFEVMTSGAGVEFGQAIGAVINVATRSGSNDFTARAYAYFRDDALDSPPYAGKFANGEPVFLEDPAPYDLQRFGGFAGGPLVRNKLFYFLGVESLNVDQTRIMGISNYWRTNGGPDSGGRANVSNGPNGKGFETTVPAKNIKQAFLVKLDGTLSEKQAFTFRHNRTIKRDTNCTGQADANCASDALGVWERSNRYEGPIWSVMGSLRSTFGARAFNELRVHYNVNDVYIYSNKANPDGKGKLYGEALVATNANGGLGQIGYPGVNMGMTSTSGLEGESNLYLTDTFLVVWGNHQVKFGGGAARVDFHMNIDASHHGRWTFPTDLVFDINDPASYPYSFNTALGSGKWYEASWKYAAFLQDTWQARKNLTLNLGLRYDVDLTPTIGNSLVDAYNKRVLGRWGYGDPPVQKITKDLNNVGPRFGFVWLPFERGQTAIRGSVGIFYDQHHGNYSDQYLNQTLVPDLRVTYNSNSAVENPLCTTGVVTTACRAAMRLLLAQSFPAFPPSTVGPRSPEYIRGIDPNFKIPYTVSYAAGFSHQIGPKFSVQADYVYNRGDDDVLSYDSNVATIIDAASGAATKKDQRFTRIDLHANIGWIRYHALMTRAEWRGTEARLGASYTLAKCRTNTLENYPGGGNTTNPFDLSVDNGPCLEDRRHSVVLDGLYQLPWDFQFAGLYRGYSALPWSVSSQNLIYTRPEPRGSRRGDSEHNVDLRASKFFNVKNVRLAAFWEMFNAFNTRNFISYSGSLQASDFGLPRGMMAPRKQQLGIRVDF